MWSFIILLALAAPTSYAQFSSDVGSFVQINAHLEANVADSNVEANLDKAAEWLGALEKESTKSNRKLLESLKTFIKLNEVGGDCSYDSARVIIANHRGCRLGSSKADSNRRIDQVVRSIAMKHYKECLPIWKNQYLSATEKFKDRLYPMMDSIIHNHSVGMSDRSLFNDYTAPVNLDQVRVVEGTKDAELVFNAIASTANHDKDYYNRQMERVIEAYKSGSWFRQQIKILVDKYLIYDCIKHNENTQYLLLSVRYELAPLKVELSTDESHLNPLFLGLARTRLCDYVKVRLSAVRDRDHSPFFSGFEYIVKRLIGEDELLK